MGSYVCDATTGYQCKVRGDKVCTARPRALARAVAAHLSAQAAALPPLGLLLIFLFAPRPLAAGPAPIRALLTFLLPRAPWLQLPQCSPMSNHVCGGSSSTCRCDGSSSAGPWVCAENICRLPACEAGEGDCRATATAATGCRCTLAGYTCNTQTGVCEVRGRHGMPGAKAKKCRMT